MRIGWNDPSISCPELADAVLAYEIKQERDANVARAPKGARLCIHCGLEAVTRPQDVPQLCGWHLLIA
jgi:hypothetical protein